MFTLIFNRFDLNDTELTIKQIDVQVKEIKIAKNNFSMPGSNIRRNAIIPLEIWDKYTTQSTIEDILGFIGRKKEGNTAIKTYGTILTNVQG